jgi:hypothetical protein
MLHIEFLTDSIMHQEALWNLILQNYIRQALASKLNWRLCDDSSRRGVSNFSSADVPITFLPATIQLARDLNDRFSLRAQWFGNISHKAGELREELREPFLLLPPQNNDVILHLSGQWLFWCANALKWREREAVYYVMTKGSLRFLTSINDVCDTLARAHNESRRLLCNTRRATWCSWGLQEATDELLRETESRMRRQFVIRAAAVFPFSQMHLCDKSRFTPQLILLGQEQDWTRQQKV